MLQQTCSQSSSTQGYNTVDSTSQEMIKTCSVLPPAKLALRPELLDHLWVVQVRALLGQLGLRYLGAARHFVWSRFASSVGFPPTSSSMIDWLGADALACPGVGVDR